uniref:Uncharacterized protein n=1 Tax=Caenorhabditis tropicalis TaxID=1561998 RepID=A0A1I7UFY6_9PELO
MSEKTQNNAKNDNNGGGFKSKEVNNQLTGSEDLIMKIIKENSMKKTVAAMDDWIKQNPSERSVEEENDRKLLEECGRE